MINEWCNPKVLNWGKYSNRELHLTLLSTIGGRYADYDGGMQLIVWNEFLMPFANSNCKFTLCSIGKDSIQYTQPSQSDCIGTAKKVNLWMQSDPHQL